MPKAIKIRIYPSQDQGVYIKRLIGSCRFVYNHCLNYRINTYNQTGATATFGELGKHLLTLKAENEWLKDSHSKVLQQTLIILIDAYKRFFINGNGFPGYRSKHGSRQSCRFPKDAIGGVRGNRINLTRVLRDIHFKSSRRDESMLNRHQDRIKSATLSMTKSGKYYLSVLIDDTKPVDPKKTRGKIIGLDVGVKDFVVTSEGKRYANLKLIRSNRAKLARLQRSVSKKVKGSSNRDKARVKLARAHEKLSNIKSHHIHQVVNDILRESQAVVVEDLNVSGMLKNHRLARSIQEVSISEFNRVLAYKAEWMGVDFVKIDRYYPSSKTCSRCGHKNDDLKLSDRIWVCPGCNTRLDRDHNAAENIRGEGLKLIGLSSSESTLGEMRSLEPSSNQEQNVLR